MSVRLKSTVGGNHRVTHNTLLFTMCCPRWKIASLHSNCAIINTLQDNHLSVHNLICHTEEYKMLLNANTTVVLTWLWLTSKCDITGTNSQVFPDRLHIYYFKELKSDRCVEVWPRQIQLGSWPNVKVDSIQNHTIRSANVRDKVVLGPPQWLHLYLTYIHVLQIIPLPTTTMCSTAHSHNCVLLSTGSTDTTIHAQPVVHTVLMKWATQNRTRVFATCVNKRACRYKNPVKTFFAFMVSQRNDHIVNVSRLHYSTSLRAVSESPVSSAVGSFEVRGLAALYCTLLKQIHLKSWIRGEFTEAGEACLTRTHTHARPRAHFWTVDFLVPSDWLVSFVYWAMFVIGLYLDYNLFQDFLQTQ